MTMSRQFHSNCTQKFEKTWLFIYFDNNNGESEKV